MSDDYEIAVDFMDMTNDRHLWARPAEARADVELSIGRHVVVGDEDADPKVAGSNPAPATTRKPRHSRGFSAFITVEQSCQLWPLMAKK